MNLAKPVRYAAGSGKWSLVGPVRCDLDNQFIAVCKRFEAMSLAERERFASQSIHPDTCWTLLTFAKRMGVFALRENDPHLFLTGLRGFGLLTNNEDPRDIMSASSRLIYVAEKFGLDPVQLAFDGRIHQPWMQRWYLDVAERKRAANWHLKDWGFREINSELGVGLIGSCGRYDPEIDLIKLAMRICRIVEADDGYVSSSFQIERPRGDLYASIRGGLWMIGKPNPLQHPDMKKQSLHMWLTLFEAVDQSLKCFENYKVDSTKAGFAFAHEKLFFSFAAGSWVSGVANIETNESIERFRKPIKALLQNFQRYRWRTWQAYEGDGCITLTTAENADQFRLDGQLPDDAKLLYEFMAETGEMASTIHHERQGWEPYQPIGEAALCPNRCGSFYYPAGSGDCPVCGHLG